VTPLKPSGSSPPGLGGGHARIYVLEEICLGRLQHIRAILPIHAGKALGYRAFAFPLVECLEPAADHAVDVPVRSGVAGRIHEAVVKTQQPAVAIQRSQLCFAPLRRRQYEVRIAGRLGPVDVLHRQEQARGLFETVEDAGRELGQRAGLAGLARRTRQELAQRLRSPADPLAEELVVLRGQIRVATDHPEQLPWPDWTYLSTSGGGFGPG
jgi:hypothetical protein